MKRTTFAPRFAFSLSLVAAGLAAGCGNDPPPPFPTTPVPTSPSGGNGCAFADCVDACGNFVMGKCVDGVMICPPQDPIECPSSGSGAGSPSARWSEGYGDGAASQGGEAVAVGPAGEIVLAVGFAGTVDFGGGLLTNASPGEMFEGDVALVKLTPDGEHIFSKSFGSVGRQRPSDVAVDAAGNIVLTGMLEGEIDFGAGPVKGGPLFVAKFNPEGEILWAKSLPAVDDPFGGHIALTASGGVAAGVRCGDGFDYGGGPLAGAGSHDACVILLDPDGGHVWSRVLGGASNDFPTDIAIGPSGEITVVGAFRETIALPGPITSEGGFDAFVARLDAKDGALLWGRGYGGPGDDGAASVVYGPDGPALAGWFIGEINLGGGPVGSFGSQGFVLWLDGDGKHRSSTVFQGVTKVTSGLERWSLALDPTGGVVLAGAFQDKLVVGPHSVPGHASEDTDLGLVRFLPDGSPLWVRGYGDANSEIVGGIAVAPSGDILVTGQYYGAPDFGNGKLPGAGNGDLYIAAFPFDP